MLGVMEGDFHNAVQGKTEMEVGRGGRYLMKMGGFNSMKPNKNS